MSTRISLLLVNQILFQITSLIDLYILDYNFTKFKWYSCDVEMASIKNVLVRWLMNNIHTNRICTQRNICTLLTLQQSSCYSSSCSQEQLNFFISDSYQNPLYTDTLNSLVIFIDHECQTCSPLDLTQLCCMSNIHKQH